MFQQWSRDKLHTGNYEELKDSLATSLQPYLLYGWMIKKSYVITIIFCCSQN